MGTWYQATARPTQKPASYVRLKEVAPPAGFPLGGPVTGCKAWPGELPHYSCGLMGEPSGEGSHGLPLGSRFPYWGGRTTHCFCRLPEAEGLGSTGWGWRGTVWGCGRKVDSTTGPAILVGLIHIFTGVDGQVPSWGAYHGLRGSPPAGLIWAHP